MLLLNAIMATTMDKRNPTTVLLLIVLVFAQLEVAQGQSNNTLTSESRWTSYYGGEYYLELWDKYDGWVDVCYDDFWSNQYDIAEAVCDSKGYKRGYTGYLYAYGGSDYAVYHVDCKGNEKTLQECNTTALYAVQRWDQRYRCATSYEKAGVYCSGKRRFYETNTAAFVAICAVVGALVLGAVVFVIMRTQNFKRQTKAKQQSNSREQEMGFTNTSVDIKM